MSTQHERKSDWKSLKAIYQSGLFCSFGFFMVGFILPIVAYSILEASAIQVALVFSFLTLGAAIFSPVAGRTAKSHRMRESIFFGAAVRALAYVGMALSIWMNDINILILNSLVWGLGAAFYRVGSDAEISERVIRENRSQAFGVREAYYARGAIFGTFIGFPLLFMYGPDTVFIAFAVTNFIGGVLAIRERPPLDEHQHTTSDMVKSAVGAGIATLVIAAALDSFITSFLSPFVELFILENFTSDVQTVAFVYLPGGIISAVMGERMGKVADYSNKIMIVAVAVLVGAISTLSLVFIPMLVGNLSIGLLLVAVFFSISSATGLLAYTVMTSVFGTAYEGRASEGFGIFESANSFARFSGPLVGGILWDLFSPSTPFIFVGLSGFVLIPLYVFGMRRYEQRVKESRLLES